MDEKHFHLDKINDVVLTLVDGVSDGGSDFRFPAVLPLAGSEDNDCGRAPGFGQCTAKVASVSSCPNRGASKQRRFSGPYKTACKRSSDNNQ